MILPYYMFYVFSECLFIYSIYRTERREQMEKKVGNSPPNFNDGMYTPQKVLHHVFYILIFPIILQNARKINTFYS